MARLSWLLLVTGLTLASARTLGQPSPSAVVSAASEQFEAAAKEDEDAHEKAGCFCQTNLAEKQQTVDNMQQQSTQLGHDIDESKARISQLDVEVKMHSEELESNSAALSTAEAIRQKDLAKFTDDEQVHVTSIDQMQQALNALENHGSAAAALIAVREVTTRVAGGKKGQIQQMQRSLRAKNSPAEVTGVLKRMVTTFGRDLQGLRDDEVTAKDRHEAIVAAKADEIKSQKKHLLGKSQRLAKTKVTLSFNEQTQERSAKLLESNINMLNTLKQLCQSNDDSFTKRKDLVQEMTLELSSAQAELAGTALLSIGQRARDDGSEKICSVSLEIVEKGWKQRAQAACKQARIGDTASKSGAADTIEELESDIREAQDTASRKVDACSNDMQTARNDASTAAKQESAEANFVGSEQQGAEEQLQDLTAQSDHADKAKADFEQISTTQQKAVQALRVATSRSEESLKHAADRAAPSAASKINEAIASAEKLMTEADGYAQSLQTTLPELATSCDNVRLAAGKVMIPLRLQKADAEEDAIGIKESSAFHATARIPNCDANKLSEEVAKLKGYRSMLGKAAESLAWETLR